MDKHRSTKPSPKLTGMHHPRAVTRRRPSAKGASAIHGAHSVHLRPYVLPAIAALVILAGGFAALAFIIPHGQTEAQKEAAAAFLAPVSDATPSGPNAYANISLIGKAAIVYDLTTGRTLFAQNSNASLPLASITKLLTLYAASNILTPTTQVTMTPTALAETNDTADTGFRIGETFSFEDIARLTLAASSNAGAEAIAEAASAQQGTSEEAMLNTTAQTLNLSQTHAVNGTGLDVDSENSGGYGSAHDIAVLAGALLQKEPAIAQATTLSSVSVTSTDGSTHSFANTDIDVTHFPNLLLSKTGYTDLAGGNLVIVYDEAINHPIAIVVLGSTESGRFTDMRQLTNATLAHFAGVAATSH